MGSTILSITGNINFCLNPKNSPKKQSEAKKLEMADDEGVIRK